MSCKFQIRSLVVFVIGFLAMPFFVEAAVFNVTSGDVSGLIAAITKADGNGEADVINLEAGTYNLVSAVSEHNSGLPTIHTPIKIYGASLDKKGGITTTIRRADNAREKFRIFYMYGEASVTIDRVRIENGFATDAQDYPSGGGISNNGRLLLTNSAVSMNQVEAKTGLSTGGGIFNGGRLTLVNTTVEKNWASGTLGSGGGVFNIGKLAIERSTITGNVVPSQGGGICNVGYSDSGTNVTMDISNSTISENNAGTGGGIYCQADVCKLKHVTITQNGADGDGAGVSVHPENKINLANSIIADNMDDGGESPDCFGTVISQGYNLMSRVDQCDFQITTGDIYGTNLNPIGANLDSVLQDNSSGNGSTLTHPLLSPSPAIGAVPKKKCLRFDQRGFLRLGEGPCDMGAFEVDAPPGCLLAAVKTGNGFTGFVGTAGDDVLTGTSGADVFHGLGGDDIINGLGGNDVICGGTGDDKLNGDADTDILLGQDGNDVVNAGSGDDIIFGGGEVGDNTLNGNAGNDLIVGGRGDDDMDGGNDKDTCNGGAHFKGDTAVGCEVLKNVP